MNFFIKNRIGIVLYALLFITYICVTYKSIFNIYYSDAHDDGIENIALFNNRVSMMTDIFNEIGGQVDGTCEHLLQSTLLEKVIKYPSLYGITLLKENFPYCSSYSHTDTAMSDLAMVNSHGSDEDNYAGSTLNYIVLNDVFAIQIAEKSQNESTLPEKGDSNMPTIVTIEGNSIRVLDGHIHLAEPYIILQLAGTPPHSFYSQGAVAGLVIVLLSIFCYVIFYIKKHSMYYSLNRAVRKNEFIGHIQPIVSSTDGSVVGGEILLRWRHPEKGVIYPVDFITLAEKTGLIIPMTRMLFIQVRNELLNMGTDLPMNFRVSFNITASHLHDEGLVMDCLDFVSNFNGMGVIMMLELTEREAIVYNGRVHSNIAKLRQAGIKLAIDDYGMGNSTLYNIQKIPFDYIKIDKSFIDHVVTDQISQTILDNIIDLAKRLNAKTIAEGVETLEQAKLLASYGVHCQQGWHWGKAMPVSEFCSMARSSV